MHRQVRGSILDLVDHLFDIGRHLRCLTPRRRSTVLALFLSVETIEAFRGFNLIGQPRIAHARNLFEQDRRHVLREIRNQIHAPKRWQLITCALVVEITENASDFAVNLEIVGMEHVALSGLNGQEMSIVPHLSIIYS